MAAVVFPILVFFAVLAFVALVAMKKGAARAVSSADWPLYAKNPLTQAEQILYHRLIAALPEHIVLAQVPLSHVIGVKKGFNVNEWNNRINRLRYDFVVCRKDASIVAAIDLDDDTPEHSAPAGADRRKEKASLAAGIRLIRWRGAALPDTVAIRNEIAEGLPSPSSELKAKGG